jgi:hypothetical protein
MSDALFGSDNISGNIQLFLGTRDCQAGIGTGADLRFSP